MIPQTKMSTGGGGGGGGGGGTSHKVFVRNGVREIPPTNNSDNQIPDRFQEYQQKPPL